LCGCSVEVNFGGSKEGELSDFGRIKKFEWLEE
jgi:hypothetical protein